MFDETAPSDGDIDTGKELGPRPVDVWVVDDNTALNESFVRSWGSAGEGFNFGPFETGQGAFEVITDRIAKSEPLPDIVFVDGNLDADEGEWRKGDYFVSQVRGIENIVQPTLIAHSNSEESNKRMMEAGADVSMEKGSGVSLRDYLQFFREYEKGRTEKNDQE